MPTYACTDHGAREEFTADTDSDADRIARDLLRAGEYEQNDPPSTFRASCRVARLGPGGDEEDSWAVVLDINPDEPACPVRGGQGHDWSSDHRLVGGLPENPGVFGSGNGQVRTVEACAACGARRTDDLGGIDQATGASMRVLTYEPPGTVTPPGMPVYWSVMDRPAPDAAAVQPEPAGVDIPAEVLDWAAGHGLSEGDPDIYLLVATEDEAENIDGEIAFLKGTVTYAQDQAIRTGGEITAEALAGLCSGAVRIEKAEGT